MMEVVSYQDLRNLDFQVIFSPCAKFAFLYEFPNKGTNFRCYIRYLSWHRKICFKSKSGEKSENSHYEIRIKKQT